MGPAHPVLPTASTSCSSEQGAGSLGFLSWVPKALPLPSISKSLQVGWLCAVRPILLMG